MCFLSVSVVAAAGSATFAWFSTNKTATAKYSNIVAKDSSYVSSWTYHSIKETTVSTDGSTYTYVFNYDSTTKLSIDQYSRLNENDAHQLLVEITLTDDAGSFNFEANADKNILPDTDEDGNARNQWSTVDWTNITNLPLSSIIAFYYTEEPNVNVNESEKTITITRSTDETSFVTLTNENPSFTQSLTLKENSTAKKVYVVLDYNLSAIDSIYSFNIGNEAFDSDEGLTFGCDFSFSVRPN